MIREKVPWEKGRRQDKLEMSLKHLEHWGQVREGLVAADLVCSASWGGCIPGRNCVCSAPRGGSLHLSPVFTFLKEMEELKEWFPGVFFQPVSTGYHV